MLRSYNISDTRQFRKLLILNKQTETNDSYKKILVIRQQPREGFGKKHLIFKNKKTSLYYNLK